MTQYTYIDLAKEITQDETDLSLAPTQFEFLLESVARHRDEEITGIIYHF